MKNYFNFKLNLEKKFGIVLFLFVLFFGIGLRVYNFDGLLIFKADQARDAIVMSRSLENGFLSLPLLGPQVGGTPFRLGPVSYYFQYVSGKIFGAKAESFAYPDLIWGILVLPLLFILLRKFFTFSISLWLMLLASVSLFLVTFSRFGWNPNGLPFFSTLFMWAFVCFLEQEKNKKRWIFLGLSALCFGIIMQLHLIAFLGLSFGIMAFLFFSKSLRWKEILFCLFIVFISNIPVLISEWKTKGENYREFKKAFERKESIGVKHAWYEKIFRAYQEGSRITWIISTGQQNTDIISTKGGSINCDQKCKSALPYSLFAMILTAYFLVVSYINWRSIKNLKKKEIFNFFWLWLGGFFIVTILLSYQIEIRFYLSIIPLIFVFLGFAIEKTIQYIKNIWARSIIVLLGIFCIIFNIQATIVYLKDLSKSQLSAEESHRDLRFGTAPKVTLGQLRNIANEASKKFDKKVPIIISGQGLYTRSLFYLISFENGYHSCYLRGDKEIPDGFNNIFLASSDNDYTKNGDFIFFGTLSTKFKSVDIYQKDFIFPKECLDFK